MSESKLETLKRQSALLRGTIAHELSVPSETFDDSSKQLLKFHGIYQQDDRDARRARGGERGWSFMVRSKIPGGILSGEQYLAHDELAGRYANGSLRITTRQDLQLHGVIRKNLRRSLRTLDRRLVTTLGACGDVVRNVACCPVPAGTDSVRAAIERTALELTARFLPRSRAYHEIWLDGERIETPASEEAEPIYGATYLPRKFKMAIASPGDNCVDVFTQDLGLVPVVEGGRLTGFVVLVGGGQGMTHNKPETFPRLGDPLARIDLADVGDVVEQIVAVQRDHGDRSDRRHARLKYLIHDRGVDWFRAEVERRLGRELEPPSPLPAFDLHLHLGWQRQGSSRWFLGVSVENGRIADRDGHRLRSAIREIVTRFGAGVHLTPQQDLLLTDLAERDRGAIDRALASHGVSPVEALSTVRRHAMACPALPTCGLALAEAERVLPAVVDRLEAELGRLGLDREIFTVRMTGCPNGCARPYVADVAFVGRSLDRYLILVGGSTAGTRLNRAFADLVPTSELVPRLLPLLERFGRERCAGERLGDFCDRLSVESLRELAEPRVEEPVDE